ncbi:MAG: phosphatase PAP2 family protein [Chloroflexota bacterium]|nr:phosphatase PAP2 family protein [Chloroflexota bacterium]
MRRIPAPVPSPRTGDPRDRLDGAVPSPAFAFLLSLITVSSLFWLVTLKRTTGYTLPEERLMHEAVPALQALVRDDVPGLHAVLLALSALGSGWFVSLGFALLGVTMLAIRRPDLAWLAAIGTLAFPIEWALKYFTADPAITLGQLWNALFDVRNIGLDDIADFPAGHALRATVFYGIVAFTVARLVGKRRVGIAAYSVAAALILIISLTRVYLGAHYPIDLLGGWMAGLALLTIAVSWHVLQADDRMRVRARQELIARRRESLGGVRRTVTAVRSTGHEA